MKVEEKPSIVKRLAWKEHFLSSRKNDSVFYGEGEKVSFAEISILCAARSYLHSRGLIKSEKFARIAILGHEQCEQRFSDGPTLQRHDNSSFLSTLGNRWISSLIQINDPTRHFIAQKGAFLHAVLFVFPLNRTLDLFFSFRNTHGGDQKWFAWTPDRAREALERHWRSNSLWMGTLIFQLIERNYNTLTPLFNLVL